MSIDGGYILLVTDRLDRGEAMAEALGIAIDVRVTGPDFRDPGATAPGEIAGIVTDINFDRQESIAALRRVLGANAAKAPVMSMLRKQEERCFLTARSHGAKLCLDANLPPRKLTAAVVNVTHPNESVVDRIVNRGLAKSGHAVGSLLKVVQDGGTIDIPVVEDAVDPVLNAIREGGLARWLDNVWVHDDVTYQHCLQVAGLAAAVSLDLRFPAQDQKRFTRAALMHDLGKGRIPLSILSKPGPLTPDERVVMNTHAALGHEILVQGGVGDRLVLDVALHHHEMIDGSGYPDRLRGDGISDPVRLMTVVDIYAALTEDRPYKRARSSEEAFRILYDMGDKLDRPMVDALARAVLRKAPAGKAAPAALDAAA